MQIDYFCFTVPNINLTDFEIKQDDSENTRFYTKLCSDIEEIIINKNKAIDLIELNPIVPSGLEICNNIVADCLIK